MLRLALGIARPPSSAVTAVASFAAAATPFGGQVLGELGGAPGRRLGLLGQGGDRLVGDVDLGQPIAGAGRPSSRTLGDVAVAVLADQRVQDRPPASICSSRAGSASSCSAYAPELRRRGPTASAAMSTSRPVSASSRGSAPACCCSRAARHGRAG